MARIPLPTVQPLWDLPSSEPRKLSTWKLQLDTLIALTDRSLDPDNKLTDIDKNNIMYAHLGAEAARRFENDPAMLSKNILSFENFYKAIRNMFNQLLSQAVAFHRL